MYTAATLGKHLWYKEANKVRKPVSLHTKHSFQKPKLAAMHMAAPDFPKRKISISLMFSYKSTDDNLRPRVYFTTPQTHPHNMKAHIHSLAILSLGLDLSPAASTVVKETLCNSTCSR